MSEQIVLPEGLATHVIGKYADPDDWKWDDDFDEDTLREFKSTFRIVGTFLGDPEESWYQGVNFTTVIRRRTDGALFGYSFWEAISKHGEPYFEANGDDGESFIFKPVREFQVTGYEVLT